MENALAEQARVRNTTPELLALDSLQERFASSVPGTEDTDTPHYETMAEYWEDFIGCLHSSETFPDGSNLSEDTGKKFAEGMVKKREQGKL